MSERFVRDPEARSRAIATNVRLLRRARGWSIREFAQIAGVSHKTLVGLENGRGCSSRTEEKVAAALATTRRGLLLSADGTDGAVRVVGAQEGRWFFGDAEEASRYRQSQERVGEAKNDSPAESPDSIQEAVERLRLGINGRASTFVQVKGGALVSGRHMVCVTEVYGAMSQDPDPNDATFLLHVLQGAIETDFEGAVRPLGPGDTMVFVARSPLVVRPGRPIGRLENVPRLLVTGLSLLNAPK